MLIKPLFPRMQLVFIFHFPDGIVCFLSVCIAIYHFTVLYLPTPMISSQVVSICINASPNNYRSSESNLCQVKEIILTATNDFSVLFIFSMVFSKRSVMYTNLQISGCNDTKKSISSRPNPMLCILIRIVLMRGF